MATGRRTPGLERSIDSLKGSAADLFDIPTTGFSNFRLNIRFTSNISKLSNREYHGIANLYVAKRYILIRGHLFTIYDKSVSRGI